MQFFVYSGGITRFQQLDNIRMDLKMDKAQILNIVFFVLHFLNPYKLNFQV